MYVCTHNYHHAPCHPPGWQGALFFSPPRLSYIYIYIYIYIYVYISILYTSICIYLSILYVHLITSTHPVRTVKSALGGFFLLRYLYVYLYHISICTSYYTYPPSADCKGCTGWVYFIAVFICLSIYTMYLYVHLITPTHPVRTVRSALGGFILLQCLV